MGNSVNKVILVGRLGKDPDFSHTPSGTPLAKVSLATDVSWTEDGEKQERTEWHNIIAWSKLAEICGKYLTKGKLVYIDGKIKTRTYDDKDGNKRYITEIVADNMVMLSGKGDGEAKAAVAAGSDTEVPF